MSDCVEGRRVKRVLARVIGLALLAFAPNAVADGTVSGECRFQRIKGRPGDYITLYEWNNFLSAVGGFVDGQSYRCGHEFGGGTYRFTSAAGNYTMYVSQPIFFARPKVVTDVQIIDSQTTSINPELAIDYSCYVTDNWTWDSAWYQTFVATGTSINRIQWRLAGWNGSSVEASVRRDNGGSITTWPQIGPAKSAGVGYGDAWTGYRSGDIPTTPGQTYAVRLVGVGGDFAIMSRNEDGNGYAQGRAYTSSGSPRNMDLNITVFSDNDGTVIPYCKTTAGLGSLTHWEGYWGQTFRATGTSLAAADLWFASDTWNIRIRFRVYQNGPGGPQIGPSKVAQGAAQTGGVGLMGVSWAPGEVPLIAGNTYYIEMMIAGGAYGFTPYRFDHAADDYPYGHAYAAGGAQTGTDLNMTIVEYGRASPVIERNPASFMRTMLVGENLSADMFTIRNVGTGTLNYTISDNATWLSCSPAAGASNGETDTIAVLYSTSTLGAGTYNATITIHDPNATNDPQTIPVILTVTPRPVMSCTPTLLAQSVLRGSNAADQSFTVQNTGGSTLNYTIADSASWLACSPTSGASTGEVDTITVMYPTSSLLVGTYNATISITDPNAIGSPQTIDVTLTVGPNMDFDNDQDVDLSDFSYFQACFNGPNRPPALPTECGPADADGDVDVDLTDFGVFQSCFNGPNRPPACR